MISTITTPILNEGEVVLGNGLATPLVVSSDAIGGILMDSLLSGSS
jgi:hypothetical protein